jgi:3-oxoacyl-[acyl-carrier-protein] synthase II
MNLILDWDSSPWSRRRDGMVITARVGVIIMDPLSQAQQRGITVQGIFSGCGMASSGFHITTPSPSTERYVRATSLALNKAGITPDQVGYINAHATSTPAGDVNEPKTIHKLFGSHTQSAAASPIKPMHLHIRPRTKT